VDELQNTIEEDEKNLIEEMRVATEEQKNGMEDTGGVSEAMAVD
jgi:THO complex subunit 7